MDFKHLYTTVINKLDKYVKDSNAGKSKVLRQYPPKHISEDMNIEKYIRQGISKFDDISTIMDKYLYYTQHVHHPHYIGHQTPIPHMMTGVANLIHNIINNPMGIYEMGPSAATIERIIINWMLEKIGWFYGNELHETNLDITRGGGIFSHGGSMANLTVMLAARASICETAWTDGTPKHLVVMAPESSHYSINRAIGIMGMGTKAIIPIKVDKNDVLIPDNLYKKYKELKNSDKKIMAVVANACSTSTGLYDPLEEIGYFCQENKLWFHVDGAHGASALIAKNQKHLLKGIEKANSVIWDAHKMLQTSTLCTAALFKNYQDLEHTFKQKGSYLFFKKENIGPDIIHNTIECTNTALGTRLFWILATLGEEELGNYIDCQYEKTKQFYEIISKQPHFTCPYYPQSNILCFQYTKYDHGEGWQLAIRNEIIKREHFYITTTQIQNARYMRLAVMNPLTEAHHIRDLLTEVETAAEKLHQNYI